MNSTRHIDPSGMSRNLKTLLMQVPDARVTLSMQSKRDIAYIQCAVRLDSRNIYGRGTTPEGAIADALLKIRRCDPNFHAVLVTGDRKFTDYERFKPALERQLALLPTEIITGGGKGIDELAKRWATERGITVIPVLPDWGEHGRGAAYVRIPKLVADVSQAIVFHDRTTKDIAAVIDAAALAEIDTTVVYTTPEAEGEV